jgi:hypothetical protein
MRSVFTTFRLAALFFLVTLSLFAQHSSMSAEVDRAVSGVEVRAVVEKAASEMRRSYVDTDLAEKAAALLEQKLRAGDYARIRSAQLLANTLHEDLSRMTRQASDVPVHGNRASP